MLEEHLAHAIAADRLRAGRAHAVSQEALRYFECPNALTWLVRRAFEPWTQSRSRARSEASAAGHSSWMME